MKSTSMNLLIAAFVIGLFPLSAPAQSPAAKRGAPSATGASEQTALASDYRLGPGDKLRIEVYKDTQLSQSLQVRPDGKITMPLIGDIVAAALTPVELRDRIATSLKEYVTNPVVTVIVVEANPAVVYVMGEVNQPGSIPLRGPMSVLQALAEAGGFREFASPKGIKILRRNTNAATVESIAFNYKDAVKGNRDLVYLRPGDMVVVP